LDPEAAIAEGVGITIAEYDSTGIVGGQIEINGLRVEGGWREHGEHRAGGEEEEIAEFEAGFHD
jgi:hypothetical protein